MATYTLAIVDGEMLMATVVDGGDIDAAVEAEASMARIDPPKFDAVYGCTLTNNEPEDGEYVWKSGNQGWIIDENGREWKYAVRA